MSSWGAFAWQSPHIAHYLILTRWRNGFIEKHVVGVGGDVVLIPSNPTRHCDQLSYSHAVVGASAHLRNVPCDLIIQGPDCAASKGYPDQRVRNRLRHGERGPTANACEPETIPFGPNAPV